jgi:hypothetical protein
MLVTPFGVMGTPVAPPDPAHSAAWQPTLPANTVPAEITKFEDALAIYAPEHSLDVALASSASEKLTSTSQEPSPVSHSDFGLMPTAGAQIPQMWAPPQQIAKLGRRSKAQLPGTLI